MRSYRDNILRKLAMSTEEALSSLRDWKLPYKTAHPCEYYTADQIRILQQLAKDYGLKNHEILTEKSPSELRFRLNGIIDNKHALQRAVATAVNKPFQVAAAIHDLEFGNADGDMAKALKANQNMYENLQILADKTSTNAFTRMWNKHVHAKLYKQLLDSKCAPWVQAAWETKQRRLEEKYQREARALEKAKERELNKEDKVKDALEKAACIKCAGEGMDGSGVLDNSINAAGSYLKQAIPPMKAPPKPEPLSQDELNASVTNAAALLGVAIGAGMTMIPEYEKLGIEIAAGSLGGLAGYHGARKLNGGKGARLLGTALGFTGGYAIVKKVIDNNNQQRTEL